MADLLPTAHPDRKLPVDEKPHYDAEAAHDVTDAGLAESTPRKASLPLRSLDPEKGVIGGVGYEDSDTEERILARELRQRGFLRRLRDGEEWLDKKMGIETQGIDRIHEEDKRPPSMANAFLFWWSLTCHVGTLPIGFLGPEFGLTLNQSVAMIVAGTLLGALCTSYCGTLGPKVSLRTPHLTSNHRN